MKTNLQIAILLLVLAIQLSCSGNSEQSKNDEPDITAYLDTYFVATQDESSGVITLEEDCWSRDLQKVLLGAYGAGGGYYLGFEGKISMAMVASGFDLSETVLKFEAKPDDGTEEAELQKKSYTATQLNEGVLQLSTKDESYILIRESDKDNYPFVKCKEYAYPAPTEEDGVYAVLMFMQSIAKKDTEWAKELIPDEGISVLTPGVGVAPNEETINSVEDLFTVEVFNSEDFFGYMSNYAENDEAEGYTPDYVGEDPDFCFPGKSGMFVTLTGADQVTGGKVTIALNEENAFAIEFIYNEKNRLKLKKIDARDCGA